MKDRLSKISKRATHALCLLAACGLTYSCTDEYKLDEEIPSWFKSSIYSYLAEGKNYTTFVQLIDDLGYKEDLSRTGSRTLFVANDSAFARFFRENAQRPSYDPWSTATSYDKLSLAQKKLLLKTGMLNNAYLMEMLSRGEGNPTPGTTMRKTTILDLADTLTRITPETLPTSESKLDKKYWDAHKDNKNFYVVSDNSTPMLVYFSGDFLAKSAITDDDFQKLFGEHHEANQYYVYQNKVIKKDITCQNGYVHELKDVLIPEPNMADIIRNSGKSNIFSHILDRFSAPYLDESLTTDYNKEHNDTISIYVRKYYSEITNKTSVSEFLNNDGKLTKGPDGEDPTVSDEYGIGLLKFDPAWNQYTDGTKSANSDMAAMFVPTDDAMREYFSTGTGRTLLENFTDKPELLDDPQSLYYHIDQIPLNVLYSLVSNLMQRSFVSSVPSKFGMILDQANDNLFKNPSEAVGHVEEVKVGNNGAVYFMNKVYPPVDFSCVASPAFIGTDYKLMKFAIYCGSGEVWSSSLMNNMNFFAYLRASGSRIKFSYFLPSDSALANYVDPLSIIPSKPGMARILSYDYKYQSDNAAPFVCTEYKYDLTTGQRGRKIRVLTNSSDPLNRLQDILETHTVVHDINKEPDGVEGGNEYFISKSGAPIRVHKSGGKYLIQGGMQIENAKSPMADPIPGYGGAEILKKYAQANNAAMDNGLSNGNTYCLNAVIQPSVKSVFSIMKDLSNQEFFNLCNGITNDMLTATGLVEIKTNDKEEDKEAKYGKYKIFMNNKGLDQNVSFFSGYNYTVYVPSDAAVLAEINEKQLPTPEKIAEYIAQYQEDPQWETVYKEKAKTQILVLLDFLRTHFQDNSIFADLQAGELQTNNSATLDPNTGTFRKIYVHQLGNNEMTVRTIDKECKVVGTKNAVARDYITTATKNFEDITDLSGILINSSAHSVVHEIDGVLRFDNIKSYTDLWDNSASAKRIIASFEKNK